jgi:flagellar biosynthesis protein FlhB
MADQDLDRNEAATPYKLEKARERGSVAKSVDANGVAILAVATLACFAWADGATSRFAHVAARLLAGAGTQLGTTDDAARLLSHVMGAGLQVIAPLLFALACVAIIVNVAQAGVVFSVTPLKPDFARLNPAQGFKRIVSVRGLYEAVKNILKLLVLGGVLALALKALAPQLLALVDVRPAAYPALITAMTGRLLVKLLLVLVVFAAIDWVFARAQYARQMRMSRREIKDEHKNREGDPRIRSRLRELRMKMLKRSQALRELPQADVLLTNPTRVAVALRYEHGVSPAPRVIAKGAGELARKMRDAAFRHQVPIVPSPALARALYREADDGGYVPEKRYADVARILVWLQAARRARAAREGAVA